VRELAPLLAAASGDVEDGVEDLAETVDPRSSIVSENYRDFDEKTPTPSKFIADSLPLGKVRACTRLRALRNGQTCREAEAQSLGAS